jgi:plastocyanin
MRRLALVTAFFALAAPAQAAAPQRLLVEATEFRFTLSRTTVKPGKAIVQLAIRGEDPHDLKLRKLGTARARLASVPETLPGGVAEWRGKLTRGKWELYCSIEGHRQAGMRTVLKVR